MAIFKCKMCGGTLEVNNETVAVCEYCGTKQTLPKLDDERKANLYDRANHFRRNNEFDKAMGIYEQILNDDNTDAESYWSLVLCRYGIEYVEDPSSHKRIPTVNRAQFTSIFDDEDYKSALQYADGYQKDIYEQEATAINDIQKGILAISSQEEPFDVFICYKESDSSGRRTPDSVLATELYHELTREGYKVFFSRITLEDKLGTAYEPYIFAALNSAKVMVVLGTKPEYFNAVWVKNEWSRYLALIKNGAKKMLIPAYKDMDPYDLPEEFSHLQAQDMSKLGFMQDLIRGIKKIVESDNTKQTIRETIIANDNAGGNVNALLKRGFMALEDGEWTKADDFFEQCLNQNAELAEAYLGKLMAELQVKTQDSLKDCVNPFNDRNNYQKAVRFADNKLKAFLGDVIQFINKRNEDAAREEVYNRACNLMNLNSESGFTEAVQWFAKVSGYKDADILADECREKAEVARKDRIYEKANLVLVDNGIKKYNSADFLNSVKTFESILDWKDSNEKAELCKQKAAEIIAQEKAYVLECERKAEMEREKSERIAKRNKKIAIITTPVVCAIIAFIIVLNSVIFPNCKYNDAIALMEAGKYSEAISAFEALEGYKDSEKNILEIKYKNAIKMINKGKYTEALGILMNISEYKDSCEKIKDIYLKTGMLHRISSNNSTLGVTINGRVLFTKLLKEKTIGDITYGLNTGYEPEGVSVWENIISVACGHIHSVGLRANGTVVAIGDMDVLREGQCNVGHWKNIVAVAAADNATFGLKSNGTVITTDDTNYAECKKWENIVKIEAGYWHGIVGLRSDGTVVIDGYIKNSLEKIDKKLIESVESWRDIVDVSTNGCSVVAVKKDGTVIGVGDNSDGSLNVQNWRNIKSVVLWRGRTIGLRNDGKLEITDFIYDNDPNTSTEYLLMQEKIKNSNIDKWTDIVEIAAGEDDIFALKSDGTVLTAGLNLHGAGNVSTWNLNK